eukprot:COSAG04_NODE_1814_length_5509_cov_1.873937_3_plen_126_part_00
MIMSWDLLIAMALAGGMVIVMEMRHSGVLEGVRDQHSAEMAETVHAGRRHRRPCCALTLPRVVMMISAWISQEHGSFLKCSTFCCPACRAFVAAAAAPPRVNTTSSSFPWLSLWLFPWLGAWLGP